MQPKNLKKLNRLLYLLNILDGGEIRVLREARELDVTERTIQRDINDIDASGFPVYKAAPGVYKFTEGFSLKKMWCYENFLPEYRREKSRKYIQNFIKKHHIQTPLQYQINSLFYCGYVDNRIGTYGTPLDVYIPTQYDIKERGFGYRLPVSIQLNSATLTKKEVKAYIDKNWKEIQTYFEQNPAIIDSHFSEKEVKIAKLREKKYKHAEILEKISPANSLNASGSTEQITEQYYRMRKKANKVISPRKSITKK